MPVSKYLLPKLSGGHDHCPGHQSLPMIQQLVVNIGHNRKLSRISSGVGTNFPE